MAGERGFAYENHIFKTLLEEGLTNNSYKPASSNTIKPDTAFSVNGKFYNLEIKLNLDADFGQGTLRYDFNNKKWICYAENLKMKELLDYYEVDKFANKEWTKIPNKVGKNDIGAKPRVLTQKEIAEDRKNFPDKFLSLRGRNPISEYYNSKDIYYIQIGEMHGFYYLGKDKAKLGVPEFNPRDQKLRIRRKGSGGGNYRFTTSLVINTSIPKSNYDLDLNLNFILNASR
jgi:hypothetical protein